MRCAQGTLLPLALSFLASTSIGGPARAQDLEPILGSFHRDPIENPWHEGRITRDGDRLRWTNGAGVTWTLTPVSSADRLETGPGNPYRENSITTFELVRRETRVQGFWFGDDFFVRDGVELRTQTSGGLKGYISASLSGTPEGFGHGVSFYVSVWPLLERPLAGFQIGLPSTWIIPDNRDFDEPLCPPGTVARDNWPERGPTWASVFQTIEGGLGFWASTRFPSATPKYRINGTPDGYNHEVSSPGWGFGRTAALGPTEVGIAQLSNRLLVPPDGLTFRPDTAGTILGNAWMALPILPAQVVEGTPTGDQSWTLFLNSAAFRGPVAFWIPETWSRLSKRYHTIDGRGLDARPGRMNGGAMEVNTVPCFRAEDGAGQQYSRIPRIRFPVDAEGRTVLFQDVALHSRATLYDSVARWFGDRRPFPGRFAENGTTRPELRTRPLSLRQGQLRRGQEDLPLTGLDPVVETAIFDRGGSQAFGLRWREPSPRGRLPDDRPRPEYRQLPEYWQRDGDRLVPVAASEVPDETRLREQTFARPRRFPSYEPPVDPRQDWSVSDPRLGPFTADLSDGSRVTYAWFRFVDQPALKACSVSEVARREAQELIEMIHRNWSIEADYLPAPSGGELAELDPALLVAPPKGFETGYVPIALAQEKIGHR